MLSIILQWRRAADAASGRVLKVQLTGSRWLSLATCCYIGKFFRGQAREYFLVQEYQGQKAIEKLRKEQNGHVKNAFFRNDIGMIDLVWGNEHRGLYHSIIHRQKENINIDDFLSNLSEVIEQGKNKGYGDNNTLEVWHKGKMAIISPIYHGYKTTFVLTAFKRTKEPKHVNERQKNKGSQKDPS